MSKVEEWVYTQPDFLARLQAIPKPSTGRGSPLRQGLKLDLMYEGDENRAWMVHFALLDAEGNLLPHMTECLKEVDAYFRVVNLELRATVHSLRLKPGTRFYVVVGLHKVASGIVTKVFHLQDNDPPHKQRSCSAFN